MTKRTRSATRRTSSTASETPTAGMLEKRVVAFAEQLGRIAGTVHAKTAGLMDGDALKKELARVRDGAADLLQRLTADPQDVAKNKRAAASATRRSRGRSGGIVDAPGKKRRAPTPAGSGATRAKSQTAKMRAAKTMVKTPRRRGRG